MEHRTLSIEFDSSGNPDLLNALNRLSASIDIGAMVMAAPSDVFGAMMEAAWYLGRLLPADLRSALEDVRAGRLDWLVITQEPERTDLPNTSLGLDREYEGGLFSDWLSLTYAIELGARSPRDLAVDSILLEWQLGSDGLHMDSLNYRELDEKRPESDQWEPHLKTSDFSSLRCVRPGPNPNVVTRIARRDEFIEGQLSETQLRTLGQPLFHCEHLQRFNPLPTGQRYFAIAQQDESGRWEMTQECLNSSIFNHQRIRGERIECKTEEARDAMEALLNARYDLDVYPQGVQWAEGTRLIIRQPGFYHGRSDGILATQKDLSGMEDWRATWGEQRWLARFNSFGDPSSREPRQTRKAIDDIDIGEVQRVLSDHHEAAKARWRSKVKKNGSADWIFESLASTHW